MSRLGFRCGYTRAKDIEGRSPCGRPVSRRKRGEPRCLGHWVVEWLVVSWAGGNADRARSAFGFFYTVTFVVALAGGGQAVFGLVTGNHGEFAVVEAAAQLSVAGVLGGLALCFAMEHPFGGRMWLTLAPLAAAALVLEGRGYVTGMAPPLSSRLLTVMTAAGSFVIALALFTGWLIFLLDSVGRHRLATCLNIVAEVAGAAIVLVTVGQVLASNGTDSSQLVMLVVMIAVLTFVRGVSRLKKLAKVFRV